MIEINILGYTITFEDNDRIWVRNPEGEGMLLSKQGLKTLLDDLWRENF